MLDERKYVLSMFEQYFEQYKTEKMAIYGLGVNTKVLLDAYPDYPVVALMDEAREGERVFDLPVVGCELAHKMGVTHILILARAVNVPIIYRRIGKECDTYGITVHDINGRELREAGTGRKADKLPSRYFKLTEEALKRKIDSCQVVSFDIFDTLVVRKTLYPSDVFLLVERKAREEGIISPGDDFHGRRAEAERELYLAGRHPTIREIYGLMEEKELSALAALRLMELEIQTEKTVLAARPGMDEIVKYALQSGKEVCATSDMYLTGDILRDILSANGYSGLDNIFVSCEHGVSKHSGLYEEVRRAYPEKKILHIGDNEEADGEMARAYGIQDRFHLCSAAEMLSDSAVSELLDYTAVLENREWIGRFIASQFGDPFIFAKTKGKTVVRSSYQLGHDFVEPIVSCFLGWMLGQAKLLHIGQILLGARDGWLLKEMLDILAEKSGPSVNCKYVYTSRSACTLAGMETEEDVTYAASLAFSGSPEQLLRLRFQLRPEEMFERGKEETDQSYILRHARLILERAAEYRDSYRQYLEQTGVETDAKLAFFDFVSSGTCQLWLEKILGKKLEGLYFLRLYDEKKAKLSIGSLFEPACVYENRTCRITDNYFFMENILSSPDPTLLRLDRGGKPIFEKESRTRKQIKEMLDIQKGVLDAFRKRISRGEGAPTKELADTALSLVRQQYSEWETDYFEQGVLKDEFCNREFELREMVR